MNYVQNINTTGNSILTQSRAEMGRKAASPFVGNGIPDLEKETSVPVRSIPLDKIKEREKNEFSESSTVELENSIYEYSLINPIAVYHEDGNDNEFIISSGHRRFKAYKDLHKTYPDDQRFKSIDCRVYVLTDNKSKLLMGFPFISREQEESIYKESNLLSRQLTYADVARQIRGIITRLDDEQYKENIRKLAESQGMKLYSEPDRVKLIISVLSSQNYQGWKRETIRQYLKIYDSGNKEILDRIESDPNYKVKTAYKELIEKQKNGRKRKTNKITSLKKSFDAFKNESKTRKYTENEIDKLQVIVNDLQKIIDENKSK